MKRPRPCSKSLKPRTIKALFWHYHKQFTQHRGWAHNDYSADVRSAFSSYVEQLARDGAITEAVAKRVTL
jgi:hypothetical protein